MAISRELVDELRLDCHGTGSGYWWGHHRDRDPPADPARATAHRRGDHLRHRRAARNPKLLLILDQPTSGPDAGPRIRVDGPLDAATAPQLHRELLLLLRTRGGTRSLTVDLTGVTHLASAAVSVLHAAVRTSAGAELRLYAPSGSTAQHVLALVELPHTTYDPDTTRDRNAASET